MGRLDPIIEFMYRPKAPPPWVWPAAMLVMGAVSVGVSLLFYPGGDEWTYVWGIRFGGGCSFLETTGLPCPSCGMTRSWVHLARGQVLTSAAYNVAGTALLLWLMVGGALGGARLLTRNYTLWQVPYNLVAGFAALWMVGLYMGVWVARLFGVNPLP